MKRLHPESQICSTPGCIQMTDAGEAFCWWCLHGEDTPRVMFKEMNMRDEKEKANKLRLKLIEEMWKVKESKGDV